MKITLDRDAFLAQLQTVTRVASTRSAIQALSGVQVSADPSGCELRATDTDVSLRVPLDVEVDSPRCRRAPRPPARRCRPLTPDELGIA